VNALIAASDPDYNSYTKQIPPIDVLPAEILSRVFFHLDDLSLSKSVSVCRNWKNIAIYAAKDKEFSLVRIFVQFLIEQMKNKYSNSNKILLGLYDIRNNKITKLNLKNLKEIESLIHKIDKEIINTLKLAKYADLKELDRLSINIKHSKRVKNIFIAVIIEKRIDNANQIVNECEKSKALQRIASQALKNGDTEKALELVNSTCLKNRKELIQKIVLYVLKSDIKKAIEIAKQSFDKDEKKKMFQEIALQLARNDEVERVIETANRISHYNITHYNTIYVIHEFALQILNNGDIEKAIEFANRLSDDCTKRNILHKLSLQLVRNNHIEKAIEIANQIKNINKKDLFCDFALKILKHSNIERALEFVNRIPDEYREYILQRLALQLADKHKFESAIEVAIQIFDEYQKKYIIEAISQKLYSQNIIERVIEFANRISDEHIRGYIFRRLSLALFKVSGDIERAVEISNQILDEVNREDAIKFLALHMLSYYDGTKKFIEIANKLSNKHTRECILQALALALLERGRIKTATIIFHQLRKADFKDRVQMFCIQRGIVLKEKNWKYTVIQYAKDAFFFFSIFCIKCLRFLAAISKREIA
jgi:hypothetical protein